MTRVPKKKLVKGDVVMVETEWTWPIGERLGIVVDTMNVVGPHFIYEVLVGLEKHWCRHHPSPGRDDILVPIPPYN